eukprot:gene8260-9814_t
MAAIYMLEGAVRRGGLNGDRENLKKEMDAQYQTSFWGINSVDQFGQNNQRRIVTMQLDHFGELQIISPISAATTSVVNPVPSWNDNARNLPCEPGYFVQGSNRLCMNATSGKWEFCQDSECVPAPIGTFTDSVGMLAPLQCPINQYAPREASTCCTLCPPGTDTHQARGMSQCLTCASGEAQPGYGQNCTHCPAGSSASDIWAYLGCVRCNDQPGGYFYQPLPGQSECIQCPEYTFKVGGTPGIHREECLCIPGTWRPDGLPGHACTRCPEGAYCSGGLQQPFTRSGVYARTELMGGQASLAGYPFVVAREGYPAPADPETALFSLPEIFFQCRMEWTCLGNFTCSEDRRGTLCESCNANYFELGDTFCIECQGVVIDTVATLLASLGTIALWKTLNTYSASEYDSLDIALQYVQYVSITQGFSVAWPQELRVVAQIFSIGNFNLDFYSPNCIMSWSSSMSVTLIFVLPVIWALALTAQYVLARCLYLGMICSANPQTRRTYRSIFRALSKIQCLTFVATETELNNYKLDSYRSALTLLNIIYNALVSNALAGFSCTELPDGSRFLSSMPELECGSLAHQVHMAACALAIPIYVIGIPVLYFWSLRKIRYQDVLFEADVVRVWGWAYTRYEPHYYVMPSFPFPTYLPCSFLSRVSPSEC